jgi:DNA-binding GntR family transcriptional regulator
MHVAAQVRLALRAGDLVPGQRLVEQDLADQYGVTRTSAREETYSELNRRLHDLIIEFSGQSVAKRQLERLNVQMVRFQFRLALRPGRPLESLPQLLAIVDAITAGDPDAADAAVAAQLASVTEQLRATHAAAGLDATPSQ